MKLVNNRISAIEIHKMLGIRKHFSQWIKYNIDKAMLSEEIDFSTILLESTGGRKQTDYLLTKEAAITCIVVSGGQFAKQVRDKVINLFQKHETGLAFTAEQITALMDICKSLTLVSIQKELENKHFALYNHPQTWWNYRAGLLGYSTETLQDAMKQINKKYKSQRQALIKLDANELIRTGAIDLMKSLGKTDEYATNVGDLCKSMAEKMELQTQIWDDTKPDQLGLKTNEVKEKKKLLGTNLRTLKQ